jgi:predicted dehydrogenase
VENGIQINEITEDWMERNFTPKVESVDGFSAEINYFVECCHGRENTICPPEQAVALMKIIDAIYRSADTGAPILM